MGVLKMTEAQKDLMDKYGIDIKNNASIITYVESLQLMLVDLLENLESIDFLSEYDDLAELDNKIEECSFIAIDILENHMAWTPCLDDKT